MTSTFAVGDRVEVSRFKVFGIRKIRQGALVFIDAQECAGGEMVSLVCKAPACDVRAQLALAPDALGPGALVLASGTVEQPRARAVPSATETAAASSGSEDSDDELEIPIAGMDRERYARARHSARWRHDVLTPDGDQPRLTPVIGCDTLELLLSAASPDLERALALAPRMPTIAFDMSFFERMNVLEAKSLARQLVYCWAAARHQRRPINMLICGVRMGGADTEAGAAPADDGGADAAACEGARALMAVLDGNGWRRWAMPTSLATPWALFGAERCVYLTAEADEELTELCADKVYILGGLVDRTEKLGESLRHAKAHGLTTAKMPLAAHVKMHKSTLSTSCCVQMLMLYDELRDWSAAVRLTPAMHVAPMRKYVTWRLRDSA